MTPLDEKAQRVKYIRALERFAKSAIAILKRDDFDEELFKKRVEKNLEVLQRVAPVFLDQPYTKGLESFAKEVIMLKDKDELIRSANLLEKLKNSRNYKKDKHRKKITNEY